MSLSAKVTLTMTLTLVLLVAFSNTVLWLVVGPRFEELEVEKALSNLGRVEQSIERELRFIRQVAEDYASWDETYTFALDRNEQYPQANLIRSTFTGLDMDAVLVFEVGGTLIWGGIYDPETGQKIGIDLFDPSDLAPDSRLINRKSEHDVVDGLLMTDRGPLMLASLPILTSQSGGPIRGTFIMGRFFSAESVEELENQASVRFEASLRNTENQNLPSAIVEKLKDVGSALVSNENVNKISSYSNIRDINNNKVLLLRVGTSKTITEIGNQTVWLTALLIGVSGSVALVVMSMFLARYVLRPVSRLTTQVVSLGEGSSMTGEFNAGGRDEIGVLSREFESMVEKLESARRELLEQSYRAGMAETASGTVHNIRNALSPVVSRVSQIRTRVEHSPTANLMKAIVETSDPTTPYLRRNKLQRYAELASKGLLDRDNEIADNLNDMLKQVSEIEKILNWQNEFTRAELAIESVNLGEVVNTAHSLIPKRMSERIEFVVDISLNDVKEACAQRISLIQVIQNILINAAEACAHRDDGRISVRAQTVTNSKHEEAIKVSISDNGIGIKRSDLDNIFKRTYTTKPANRGGVGLHWCANALGVMNGKIYAESDGPDCGATIHIVLPTEW